MVLERKTIRTVICVYTFYLRLKRHLIQSGPAAKQMSSARSICVVLQSQRPKHVNTEMNNLLAEKSTSSRTTAVRPNFHADIHRLNDSYPVIVSVNTRRIWVESEEEEGAKALVRDSRSG